MTKQFCNQCEKQCPVDALQCGKGSKNFGLEPAESGKKKHGWKMPEGPLGILMQCGHFLHHGGADGENLLGSLSPDEQVELERLLTVLLDDWKKRMSAVGHEHSHYGR